MCLVEGLVQVREGADAQVDAADGEDPAHGRTGRDD
jgi:hypothetical protein